MPHTRAWATARKARTLTTTSASGCRACSSWPTGTKLWKRRSHTPSRASFRLVENAVNDFRQINFLRHNRVLPQTNGAKLQVFCILVQHFVHERVFILVLQHKGNKLLYL